MQGSCWLDRLSWVRRHSPLTRRALELLPTFPGAELFICFHIDLKMVPVVEGLAEKVSLQVIPCNTNTVDADGWRYLQGVQGVHLLQMEEALARLETASRKSRYLCDLGAELICHAQRHDTGVLAAMEGTTSGIARIAREVGDAPRRFPILDWNSAPLKNLVHNEKMVGFSLWQTFSEVTRLSLHGLPVGVLGYGPVGRGIARTAQQLGAIVAVHDPNAVSGKLAEFDGFAQLERTQLLARSRILVTATGRREVLGEPDLRFLPQGAFLLNAGHGCEEIGEGIRQHPARKTVLAHVEEIAGEDGRHCFLLARGELLNLAAGFGDTINGFDLTSAQLVQAIRFLLEQSENVPEYLPRDFLDTVLS